MSEKVSLLEEKFKGVVESKIHKLTRDIGEMASKVFPPLKGRHFSEVDTSSITKQLKGYKFDSLVSHEINSFFKRIESMEEELSQYIDLKEEE